jgi:hypothetical protein
MSGDDESLELKLARQAYAEAEQIKKAAEQDLEAARYDRGQADRSLREIQVLEASIAKREQALKQAGEPEFLARVAAADKALADAKALIASVDKERHAAAINMNQLIEHDKREHAAAGLKY